MANAVGYEGKQRTELRVDVNRDFAFDTGSDGPRARAERRSPMRRSGARAPPLSRLSSGAKDCMRSVAARALNELWRRHVFQLAVTFHGGMLAVACERAAVARARGARAARSRIEASAPQHTSQITPLSLAQGTSGARPRTRRRAAPT